MDNELFCRTFFPNTVRQPSPHFHREVWQLFESNHRLVNLILFRGSGKTSILRMGTMKRIAYGVAHTIIYVGKSEGHAVRSVKWIRQQIEHNRRLSTLFHLRPGSKWQDTEAEIIHGLEEYPIWIMAMGITGSVRGINQADRRPDLIVLDDVIDEENSATPEQRHKIEALIYGALKESLAPASESPDAKMVMLQTPLNKEDACMKALSDPEWHSARFGCWTRETEDRPLEEQQSAWPERWPTEVLREEKRLAIQRNQLSLWLREKECKIISPETSAFREEWLEFYDLPPEKMRVVMAIDPVPPPSDSAIAKGLRGRDYEALVVLGACGGSIYLLEYSLSRGHEPNWTVAEFFRLAYKWKPQTVRVESVAYQRTLAWLLRQAMNRTRRYYVVEEVSDRRRKYDRIIDTLSGVASAGQFFVRRTHSDFIEQFRAYPDVAHDDLLDATALAVDGLLHGSEMMIDVDEEVEPFVFPLLAP